MRSQGSAEGQVLLAKERSFVVVEQFCILITEVVMQIYMELNCWNYRHTHKLMQVEQVTQSNSNIPTSFSCFRYCTTAIQVVTSGAAGQKVHGSLHVKVISLESIITIISKIKVQKQKIPSNRLAHPQAETYKQPRQ